jgi:hypothetical protein
MREGGERKWQHTQLRLGLGKVNGGWVRDDEGRERWETMKGGNLERGKGMYIIP